MSQWGITKEINGVRFMVNVNTNAFEAINVTSIVDVVIPLDKCECGLADFVADVFMHELYIKWADLPYKLTLKI